MKILIVYDSRSGNTEKMAYEVAEGVKEANVEVHVRKVDEASVDELPKIQGLILGSPVYYGLPTGKLKEFIDASVKYHGKLTHIVGAAFCSAGGTHTGSETTIMALNEAMLVHGMIVQGNPPGSHSGVASVGAPDDTDIEGILLEYRYSTDNNDWDTWTQYGEELGIDDLYQWEFKAKEGSGYYQFRVKIWDSAENIIYSEVKTANVTLIPTAILSIMIFLVVILVLFAFFIVKKFKKITE